MDTQNGGKLLRINQHTQTTSSLLRVHIIMYLFELFLCDVPLLEGATTGAEEVVVVDGK